MVKLIRLLKVVKERNTISKYLNEVLKVSVALERLVFFCFLYVLLVHIIACFWVIIATFEDSDENNFIMWNHFGDFTATGTGLRMRLFLIGERLDFFDLGIGSFSSSSSSSSFARVL